MTELPERHPRWPTRARVTVAALMCTTILAGAAALGQGWPAFADQPAAAPLAPASSVHGMPQSFADVIEAVKPAVVNVAVSKHRPQSVSEDVPDLPPGSPMSDLLRHFFEQQRGDRGDAPMTHGLGSGFIIDPAGYIVTNNHVSDGAGKITVTLTDGSVHEAKVIGSDSKTDLAVLKIDAGKPLPYVQFGDSAKSRVGDWVVAIGDPYGLGGTATAGIISARGRDIGSGPYDDFIQIDAPINPGNSGGPLFDQSGKVIGVDTAIYSPNGGSVGIGFAIPSATVAKVVDQLRDHGSVERGWLGVQMQPMTAELAQAMGRSGSDGVLVNGIEPDSPAAKADLRVGDIITGFDGKPIKDPRDLAREVADAKGADAKLAVWRDGKERTLVVSIGTAPSERTAAADAAESSKGERVGLALAPLTAEARSELNLDSSLKGVVVADVTPGSHAAESGLQAGDVILRIGSDIVASPKEAIKRIRDAQAAKSKLVPVLVMRDGDTRYLALELAKA